MAETVIGHVLGRLSEIGVGHVFGVPGDYAFPVNDAILEHAGVEWVGCSNELNAAYAADGYARVRGVAALCTTYGVGELSAINGVAGAFAEHLPLFHLVGAPNVPVMLSRRPMHHTLGNGEHDLFARMTEPVVCARAVMTPQNVAAETERLIAAALYHRRPVYMVFPADMATRAPLAAVAPPPAPASDPAALAAATEAIIAALGTAGTACALPGILVDRAGLRDAARALIDASGLPYATMFMDKTVLDEATPGYVGIYDGALMDEQVRAFVEGADRLLVIGALASDFNTGAFTAKLDPARRIDIGHHNARVDGRAFCDVEMGDLIAALTARIGRRAWPAGPVPGTLGPVAGAASDPITAATLYPRWEAFLRPDDILVAETGTVSMGLGFARMPEGARFHNQTLWGSIGWATPAAFGAAVAAAPGQRVILVTGDGSHQLTAQAIGDFGARGLKPIVFVLNNDGYLIERLLCRDPEAAYNDIPRWRYADLPRALGCAGWYTARATTLGEFDAALEAAAAAPSGAYVEVVTDPYAASPLAERLGAALKAAYRA
ncbi:MAG: indole-3-pyruvate decarboxylase [Rhodovulum sulfidophilum]|uniref:Indole-3-pyruvate decarboxylase n=1 Tax=Rhodovulum sulfidophilum TaxID=35806 RepID=A0A2W5N7A4_RHOSU|nr:MAG: indole-3-pyruvate decarboxylase [Rhodovulum sulfidophilum]